MAGIANPDKLTIKQILETFPQECIDIAPVELKRINKQIKEWKNFVRDIKEADLDIVSEIFNLGVAKIEAPRSAIEHKQTLELIIKMTKNPKMGFDRDKIDTAKQMPILELFNFVKVKRTGKRMMVSCPFHTDNSPSMMIDAKNRFKCFSCGEFGDSISFVMKLHGIEFLDAIKLLTGGI